MKVPEWIPFDQQVARIGNHRWNVMRLVHLAKDLPVIQAPIDLIALDTTYNNICMRDMVMHMQAVQDADITYPILLDENGFILDGRHRLMRAMLFGIAVIPVKRFDVNPTPCEIVKDDD